MIFVFQSSIINLKSSIQTAVRSIASSILNGGRPLMNRPNDEPNTAITAHPASGLSASALSRGLRFKLAALSLTLISALSGIGLARLLKTPAPELGKAETETKYGIPARLFRDWNKPDFVLVLSAQQHGYMLPCGCSRPQVGG